MTTSSRADLHPWSTPWVTAPPPSCSTLRNLNGAVAWGQSCVFAQEDGDPLPFSINTACMPWVTSNIYPSPSVFYSPATACPTSWTAVATRTTGTAWAAGETGLRCCPGGFEGDGGDGCRPGSSSGVWPVLECGEADADENALSMYTASAWPAGATPSVPALRLRFQASDVGSASPGPSSSSTPASSARSGGLSTGSIVALAVAIPLAIILGAFAAFFLWRRRRRNGTASHMQSAKTPDEKDTRAAPSLDSSTAYHPLVSHETPKPGAIHSSALTSRHAALTDTHEIPEWNAELPASEASQTQTSAAPPPAAGSPSESEPAELGGLLRVARKPIAPVEIDGTAVVPEVGDAYIPYRPGGGEQERA